MSRAFNVISLALVLLPTQANAAEWLLGPATEGIAPVLTYGSSEPVSYRFECTPSAVIVTETGVTKLMDFGTGTLVGDGDGATMTPGAAMMALYGGKGEPDFAPAEATKNPAGGWDLAQRLPKNHKQLKAIGSSDMMSLFTSGYTMAVALDDGARATWNEFMRRCKATN